MHREIAKWLLGLSLAASQHVEAAPRVDPLLLGTRPSNLYAVVSEIDPPICRPVLRSLNEPLTSTVESYYSNLSYASDVLFGSRLQVPWQRKPLTMPGTGLLITVDFAEVALGSDGRKSALYRLGDKGVTTLYILPKPEKGWSDHQDLSTDFEARLLKYEPGTTDLLEAISNLIHPKNKVAAFITKSTGLNLNVLRVHDRTVLIAADEFDSNAGVFRGKPFRAYAFLYDGNRPPSLICEFKKVRTAIDWTVKSRRRGTAVNDRK